MQVQIATEMSKLKEESTQQAEHVNQAVNLKVQYQQLAEIMEEKMTHHEQMSVLSWMHLQQVEEVKVQSQEIYPLLGLVEQQHEAIKNYQVFIVFLGNQELQHHALNPG